MRGTTTNAKKINQVLTWILEGASEHAIHEAIESNWPGEDAMPLILAATEQMNRSAQASHATIENWALEATKLLFQRQLEVGEFGGAMRAIRQIIDISSGRKIKSRDDENAAQVVQIGVVTNDSLDDFRERLARRIVELSENGRGPEGAAIADRRTGRIEEHKR